MALFSRGIIEQKPRVPAKIRSFPELFLSEFAHESVLILNPIVLDAEFNSLSDGIIFNWYHRVKTNPFRLITNSPNAKISKKRNILSGFSMIRLPS